MDLRGMFAGFPDDTLRWNEPMREHTSFKTGGPVELMILPQTKAQVQDAVEILRTNAAEYFVMGNGSNLLVKDAGYRGVVIKLGEGISAIKIDESTVTAEAGASLARIAGVAMNAGLKGFEFASGIPGTFGGAVCMNAGAYGGEIKDVLVSAEVMDADGRIQIFAKDELELSYRSSRIQRENLIVLQAVIVLEYGDVAAIKARTRELNDRRREKQPLEFPSAGSTFKRPEGYYAGKLIMDAGLAGLAIGGAKVSEKHCGFIINTGGATADDILRLMSRVAETVKDKFGVTLEPEVKVLG